MLFFYESIYYIVGMECKLFVFVIEDEKDIVCFIELELVVEGYVIEVVFDGVIGLLKFCEVNFDLVIFDLMLLVFDGFEVVCCICKMSNIFIIILIVKDGI